MIYIIGNAQAKSQDYPNVDLSFSMAHEKRRSSIKGESTNAWQLTPKRPQ